MGIRILGKEVADGVYNSVASSLARMPRKLSLGIVVCGHDPVIENFVGIKKRNAERLGIEFIREDVSDTASQAELISVVHAMNERADGVIMQLPLPVEFDTDIVLSAIDPSKDVDALNPTINDTCRSVHAPVAEGIMEMLKFAKVDVEGKKAVVIGAGRLVGAPTAELLRIAGADVRMVTLNQGSLEDARDADIVVSGAGSAGLVKPHHIMEGAVVIDAGTSEQGKKIAGDIDVECYARSGFYTTVPGGVGPVAVSMIYKNLVELSRLNIDKL